MQSHWWYAETKCITQKMFQKDSTKFKQWRACKKGSPSVFSLNKTGVTAKDNGFRSVFYRLLYHLEYKDSKFLLLNRQNRCKEGNVAHKLTYKKSRGVIC